jgi:hypothetical protein
MPHVLTSINSSRPLTKHFDVSQNALSKTPNVPFRVSSQETEFNTVSELALLITEVAGTQDVILVGKFKKKLNHESRKGQTDTGATNHLLIIDVDKYQMPSDLPVQDLPQAFVNILPMNFHDTHYVWQYSASYHTTSDPHLLSGHLFFVLDAPLAPNIKKYYLTGLNFLEPFNSQLTLSGTGRNLHYVIDPVLAENSRIVYVAPPTGLPKDKKSILEQHKLQHIHHVSEELWSPTLRLPTMPRIEKINESKATRIKELRHAEGLPTSAKLFKTEYNDLYQINILTNPGQGGLTLVDMDDTYIRMNLNDGNSNSYWARKSHPEVVRCFKNEDAFYMKDVDIDFYNMVQDMIKKEIAENVEDIITNEGGVTDDITKLGPLYQPDDENRIVFGFYSNKQDAIHSCIYDLNENQVHTFTHSSMEKLEMSLSDKGRHTPTSKSMPNWEPVFNPTDHNRVNFIKREINSFTPNKILYDHPEFSKISLPEATRPEDLVPGTAGPLLKQACPYIYLALKNGVGCPPSEDTSTEFEHLLNWIAYIIQTRKKTERAWLLQGVTQSGKSTLVNRIFDPIFSSKHANLLKFSQSTDQFNAELEHLIVVGYDEVKMDTPQQAAAMEDMKNMITEKKISVRAMRQNKRTITNYSNFVFCTNHADSFPMNTGETSRFNVGNYQPKSLSEVYKLPKGKTYEQVIDADLPAFVSFMQHYQIDEFRATTALNNHAKALMIDSTRPFPARFCDAIKNGDFNWFIENMPTLQELEGHQLDPTALSNKTKALNNGLIVLNRITREVDEEQKPKPVSMLTRDLLILYTALTADQKVMSGKGFHTMLKKNNLPFIRTTRDKKNGRFLEDTPTFKIEPLDVAMLRELTPDQLPIQPNTNLIAKEA